MDGESEQERLERQRRILDTVMQSDAIDSVIEEEGTILDSIVEPARAIGESAAKQVGAGLAGLGAAITPGGKKRV